MRKITFAFFVAFATCVATIISTANHCSSLKRLANTIIRVVHMCSSVPVDSLHFVSFAWVSVWSVGSTQQDTFVNDIGGSDECVLDFIRFVLCVSDMHLVPTRGHKCGPVYHCCGVWLTLCGNVVGFAHFVWVWTPNHVVQARKGSVTTPLHAEGVTD